MYPENRRKEMTPAISYALWMHDIQKINVAWHCDSRRCGKSLWGQEITSLKIESTILLSLGWKFAVLIFSINLKLSRDVALSKLWYSTGFHVHLMAFAAPVVCCLLKKCLEGGGGHWHPRSPIAMLHLFSDCIEVWLISSEISSNTCFINFRRWVIAVKHPRPADIQNNWKSVGVTLSEKFSFKVIRDFEIHWRPKWRLVKYHGQRFQLHFKILLFLIYFDTRNLPCNFLETLSNFFRIQSHVKWSMTSLCCHGNSDLGKMYVNHLKL